MTNEQIACALEAAAKSIREGEPNTAVQYFSYDPEDGVDDHSTAAGADERTKGTLEQFRGDALDDGWFEGTEELGWGVMITLEQAECEVVADRTDYTDEQWEEEWPMWSDADQIVNYSLQPLFKGAK